MGKIKVLQVNKLYYPETGGIERTVQNIAEGLCEKTDMQVLVCQKKGKSIAETVNGIRVFRSHSFGVLFSMPISFSFLLNLRRMAREQDILQFHMPFPLGDLGCLLSGYKGKVVTYWHSDVVKQKKFMILYRPIMERFLKRADVILVGAQGIIDGSEYLKPYREKCRVVPFAVSEDIWQDGEKYLEEKKQRQEETDQAEGLNFLFVGRLVYYKGCDVLLEAMKYVKRGHLTMIGTGVLENVLKERCKELQLEDRITFAGQQSDEELKQGFRDMDVFILPSVARSEAFALVQLEAMAYGKPVINTNLPSGVPDVSLHGVTGRTVEPGDARALADAMNWMTDHPQETLAYGLAAKKRVDQVFTLKKILPQIYHVYEELLEEKTEVRS